MLKLVPNWGDVLLKAYSMWGVYALLFLTALQYGLPVFEMEMPLNLYETLTALIAAAIAFLRVLDQKNVQDFLRSEDGWFRMPQRKRTKAGIAALVIAAATPFIADWEGLRTQAYRDIVGVPTVCYGETKGVRMGDRYTAAECFTMLEEEVVEYYARVERCMTNDNIPVGVQASMLELAYNVGTSAVCKSTMMRKANAGDYEGACNELSRWVRAGGRKVRGLENRRADSKERLCLQGI